MALQEGAKGYVMFNGNPLALVTSITRRTESGQIEMVTLEDALAGFTPGGGTMTVTVNYAILISGTEDEFQSKCVNGEIVALQVGFGPKATVSEGKIISTEESISTGAATEGSFEWRGKPVAEE